MDGMEDELPPSFVSKIDNNKSYNVEIERLSSSPAWWMQKNQLWFLVVNGRKILQKKKTECS